MMNIRFVSWGVIVQWQFIGKCLHSISGIRPKSLSNFQLFGPSSCNTILLVETSEVIYVNWLTTGSVGIDSVTVRSDWEIQVLENRDIFE